MQTVADPQLDRKKKPSTNWLRRLTPSTREHREHAAAAAALLLFTVILFAPVFSGKTLNMVAPHMYTTFPWTGVVQKNPEITGHGFPQTDCAETIYPNSVFATNAIRSGQFPMWLPYSFSGVPLLELGLTEWLYPPRLLVMLFMEPTPQHDTLLFTHLLAAGLGMYGLLRLWGANVLGALLGGLVWELNGHNAFWLTLEHVALAAAWLPLMLAAATLAIRRQSFRWATAAGAALGMAVLTGSLHYVYLGALLLVVCYGAQAVWAAGLRWREGDRRATLACLSLPVCSAMTAVVLSAANWLPMTEQLALVHREPHTLEQQLAGAIPAGELISALFSPRGMAGLAGKPADFAGFAFTGIAFILAVAAAIIALARGFRRAAPMVLGILVCLLSLGFALGFQPLVRFLRLVIPYFGTFHPHAGFYLFCFGVGVLAAFGMTEAGRLLAGSPGGRPRRYVLFAAGCAMVVVVAAQLLMLARAITPVQPASPAWLFPETPLIQTLKELQGSYHILPVSYRHPTGKWYPPVLAGKVAADFELRSSSGYESLLPLPTAGLWRTVEQGGRLAEDVPPSYRPYFYHDGLPMALLEKLSVGFLVTPPNTTPRDVHSGAAPGEGMQCVYRGPDGWIYQLNRALPRAFLVPQAVAAPDPPTSLKMLVDEKFDARRAAIVIGEQTAAQTGLPAGDPPTAALEAAANIVSDRLNEVEVEAETPRPAMLVLNDSWGPGWRVTVDGVPQSVLRVNYAFRGVVVPEGKHRVRFLYRPPTLLTGLWISAGVLLLLLILYAKAGADLVRRGYLPSQLPASGR